MPTNPRQKGVELLDAQLKEYQIDGLPWWLVATERNFLKSKKSSLVRIFFV
jgi:hypothetical protein